MEKTYNPKVIESKWSKYWEDHKLSNPAGDNDSYCIVLPPPNVTGTLHMGHGFQQTLMDILIRHQRMLGKQTLWQGGTDHAGIATQMVVENQLLQQGKTRHDLGREKFIEQVWNWRNQSGNTITTQMKRLGVSIDWSKERFSMDETLSYATIEAFIKLYNEGLIYRGQKLVNWDPQLRTAISDLEVETEETTGKIWTLRYPLLHSNDTILVATTRPETLLGDVAVAVHPDDKRYQSLIGKQILLPLAERSIPIIADKCVDPEFGTGCVKITPAHDFNDYDMGQRHKLPLINILTPDAYLNENCPEKYQGLERFAARKQILRDLDDAGLLEKIADHRLSIPKGERSGAIIEPYLTNQWFVSMKTLSKAAIDAVKSGKLKFVPQNWEKTYFRWLENIEDWCISRQLWWGHQIPVWYDEENNTYVGHHKDDVRERYQLAVTVKLRQAEDVLDTWFSASLWPFATLGWPLQNNLFKTFYPTQVLVTGFDIIFFWVARMVMMGLKLTNEIPFSSVYITGLIRDSQGKKMSKSKGNILDPIDLIDGIKLEDLITKRTKGLMQPKMTQTIAKITRKEFPKGIASYGTDALRFTFCALATTGRDINFDMGRIEGYRNFCNKLWNASRFVLMNLEKVDLNPEKAVIYDVTDTWIKSQLQLTIKTLEKHFANYRFDLLAQTLYEFIWNEYCDWYLELAKCSLYGENSTPAQQRGTLLTLTEVLESLLCLTHPIMPFITEEIWQSIAPMVEKNGHSIMTQRYPVYNHKLVNFQAHKKITWLKNIVTTVRTICAEVGISPAKSVPLIFYRGDDLDREYTEELKILITTLTKADSIQWANSTEVLQSTATDIVQQLEIHIPLAGIVNKESELARLDKEINKLEKEKQKIQKMLDNKNYVEKAPTEVVNNARDNFKQTNILLKKLATQKEKIQML